VIRTLRWLDVNTYVLGAGAPAQNGGA
jgi:hypothetical protein